MKSYCVKQRKRTDCVPGSEQISLAKNGRRMMKCQCAECGITKTQFAKGIVGGSPNCFEKKDRFPLIIRQP